MNRTLYKIRIQRVAFWGLFVWLLWAPPAWARWRTLKTEHFTVFYQSGDEARARQLLSAMEKARPRVETLTGNHLRRYPVVIQDMGSLVNSLTDPLNGVIQLFPCPPASRDELSAEDWFLLVGTHEYTHALNLTEHGGFPRLLTFVGGTSLNANLLNPDWAIEGVAVYSESQFSNRSGRLNDGLYDAVVAAQGGSNRKLGISRTTHLPWEYPGGFQYMAGGLFHGYLAGKYGSQKITEFYRDQGSRFFQWLSFVFPAVGIDRAAHRTFGKTLPGLWADWRDSIREKGPPRVAGEEQLTRRGWDMGALQIRGGKAYYQSTVSVKTEAGGGFTFYRVIEHSLATGSERTVVSTTASFMGPIRLHGGKLYYATTEYRRGYANTTTFGYVSRLWEHDLATGRERVLMEDPFRAFELLPDGTILYSVDRKDEFGSVLWSRATGAGAPRRIASSGFLVDELLADGKRVVATARASGGPYGLYLFDPVTGDLRPLFHSACLTRAEGLYGDQLLFTADIHKTYGIYRYDFRTRKTFRMTEGGYAVCGAIDESGPNLYGIGLNEGGNDLYRYPWTPERFALPKAVATEIPADPLAGVSIVSGGYGDNLKRMVPRILHLPFYYDYGGERFYGAAFAGGDAVYDFPAYVFALGHDEVRGRPIGEAVLTSAFFAPLALAGQYQDAFGDRTLTAEAAYPLALRLSPGLSSLWAGTVGDQWSDGSRRDVRPYLTAGFQWPGMEWSTTVQTPVESRSWGSQVDRKSFFGTLSLRQYLPASQIQLSGTWISDMEDPDWPFSACRGCSSGLPARRGCQASADYSIPFLKVRRGLWNPCLYAEDVVLGLYADGAWAEETRSQESYGVQLQLEGSVTTAALPVALGVRWGRTRDGQRSLALGLSFNLPFYSAAKPGPRPSTAPPWRLMDRPTSDPNKPPLWNL